MTVEKPIPELAAHPAAVLFPMLDDAQLRELAEDIKEHGLIEPIVLHDSAILDGRNRYAACRMANVGPRFTTWNGAGGSPTLFVMAKNLHRRHLTTSQRAAIGAELVPMLKAEAKLRQLAGLRHGNESPVPKISSERVRGEVREIAAKAVGVSGPSVQAAVHVKEAEPETFEKVKRGEANVYTEVKRIKAAENPAVPAIGTKRRAMLDNATRNKVIDALSMVRGVCSRLGDLKQEAVVRALSEEERKEWAEIAKQSASQLREFARILCNNNSQQERPQ